MAGRRVTLSEDQLMDSVIALAEVKRLLVHHCKAARLPSGRIAVPIRGNKGFQDLVLAGPGGQLFAELKNDFEKQKPDQVRWMEMVNAGGGVAVLWRPVHWFDKTIERALTDLAKPRGGGR